MTIYCLLYVCSDWVNCNKISLNMTLGVNTEVILLIHNNKGENILVQTFLVKQNAMPRMNVRQGSIKEHGYLQVDLNAVSGFTKGGKLFIQ